MMQVAIITGGPSAEREIALQSAAVVAKYLDPQKYTFRSILLEDNGMFDQLTGHRVDMNDFSIKLEGQRVRFEFVFLIIHGTPVEDGLLQGYFESQRIPHSTCNTLTSALTFNKQWCKDMLASHNVAMARSSIVMREEIASFDPAAVECPVFVKPNNNGSSYGVSKVLHTGDIKPALEKAAEYDHEIMIEKYLQGREFSCGAVKQGREVHTFPITEIIPEGEFFDYAAKYLGASQEITPADLEPALATKCQALSRRLYALLNCRGIVRFDYILVGEEFNLLEVNTVPGMSEASIVPQQAMAYGWTIGQLLDVVVDDAMSPTLHPS